jgi:LysM repeat protein
MTRSVWFWVVIAGLGLLLWLGRDQIANYFDKLPLQTTPRTTDTQKLASATPSAAKSSAGAAEKEAPEQGQPPAQATPAEVAYISYVVKKGDTLYSLSRQYGIPVAELQQINGIEDPQSLKAGQTIKIPKKMTPTPPPTSPTPAIETTTYTVQPGDNLSDIARKFNTTVATLQRLNNFANPNQLQAGSTILVPVTGATPGAPATPAGGMSTPPPPSPAAAEDQEVTILPVLTPVTAAAMASSPGAATTLTPLPTIPSICNGNKEAVFIWGVSFCVPPGWALQEYVTPYRTALLTRSESGGNLSLYAISLLDDSPNAPLSLSMMEAKDAVAGEISALIPGGLAPPETWTVVTSFEVAGELGQVSEATTRYLASGEPARVRVVVFNGAGKRWRIVVVAPEALWQVYDADVFPYITRTMDVY